MFSRGLTRNTLYFLSIYFTFTDHEYVPGTGLACHGLIVVDGSVADLDPGSGAFFTSGSGMGKNPDPGSEINIPDHISEILVKNSG